MTNDTTAEMVACCPDRLVGLGLVPLHDPACAVQFVRRAKCHSKTIRDGILGRNSARFFGIKV